MSYRCSPSSGFYWSKEKITEAGTPTIRMDCHPNPTNWRKMKDEINPVC